MKNSNPRVLTIFQKPVKNDNQTIKTSPIPQTLTGQDPSHQMRLCLMKTKENI